MANEFKHVSVGTDLSQVEWESTAGHVLNSQATGDVIYASSASQLTRLGIGSSAQVLTVTAGLPVWATPATPTAPLFFDLLQTAFRTPRRLLGMFTATYLPVSYDAGNTPTNELMGIGFRHNNTASSMAAHTMGSALLESYTTQHTGSTGTDLYCSQNGGYSSNVMTVSTAPNKNPRMSVRYFPSGGGASIYTFVGFMASGVLADETASGAYLRTNTTGNLFFVTRQGASETTTDLGVRPTSLKSYEIETTDSGVTWTCRNVTTATVVATHTTNVPTATSGLGYVIGTKSTSGDQTGNNVNYCEVESNSVA